MNRRSSPLAAFTQFAVRLSARFTVFVVGVGKAKFFGYQEALFLTTPSDWTTTTQLAAGAWCHRLMKGRSPMKQQLRLMPIIAVLLARLTIPALLDAQQQPAGVVTTLQGTAEQAAGEIWVGTPYIDAVYINSVVCRVPNRSCPTCNRSDRDI
jgi:hypothetical protein